MLTTTIFEGDRFSRQRDLVPSGRLTETRISVIGVGAIGRQVALQLAALGARRLQLVDFDAVDETNVTTQGYTRHEVGMAKVDALELAIHEMDPSIDIERIRDRFRPKQSVGEAVFCCVDSIAARAAIWRSVGSRCEFWADGRMLGETIRVLVAADDLGRLHYPQTLFQADEAQPGRCTARSTLYSANIGAGLMVHQFVRWLRHQATDRELSFNLLASELVADVNDLAVV